MSNLIGQFYFKKGANGNLFGEFSNNHSTWITTESADLTFDKKKENPNNYIGKYYSTWQEEGKPHFAILTITRKANPDAIDDIFTLTWEIKGEDTFWGEGFIIDKMLIGHYRNFPNINL